MKLMAPFTWFRSRVMMAGLATALSGAAVGCVPPEVTDQNPVESSSQGIVNTNGIRVNGIRVNGIRVNGIRVNGIRVNGIRVNGIRVNGIRVNGLIADSTFASWFQGTADGVDRESHAEFMKYLTACALRTGESLTFVDELNTSYSWSGGLGLAPLWFDQASTETENQLVSACLMGHVNTALPEPKHIQISLRGDAPGLATTPVEEKTLKTYDGTFFGDIFSETPKMYLCKAVTAGPVNYIETLLKDWGRQCYFTNDGCGGVFEMVDCSTACNTNAGGGVFGKTCTLNGKTYPAIHVFVPHTWRTSTVAFTGTGGTTPACTNCLEKRMLKLPLSTSTVIKLQPPAPDAGQYVIDVRYANGGTAPLYLKVKNGSTYAMNGASDKWDFPPTGGADTWGTRSILVTLKAGEAITLTSAGSTTPGIDAVSIRFP